MTRRITVLFAALLLLLCIPPALGSPSAVSYEQYVTLIHDQDGQGDCIGHSATHILEIHKEMEAPYSPDPSFAFMEYVFKDAAQGGTDPRVSLPADSWQTIVSNYGLPPETSYPTDFDRLGNPADVPSLLSHPPLDTAFDEAQAYRLGAQTTSLSTPSIAQAEEMLNTSGPLMCLNLFPAHAVALIGYSRTAAEFTIVDSANWQNIGHAAVKKVAYSYFASRQPNMTLESATNVATPLVHPYTARIRISHVNRRSLLTVKIGAVGREPLTVWDRNNHVNHTDWGKDLAIDVPLPWYAGSQWPPSDQNRWYVEVTNHDDPGTPGNLATLSEVTLVKRNQQSPSHPVTCDVYSLLGGPVTIAPGTTWQSFEALDAGFSVSSRIGYEPFTATFTDTTTGNPTGWLWEFGDGETSTEQHPTHTYQGALSGDALYTVRLTVSNEHDTKTATKTDFIRVLPLSGGLARVEAEDYESGGEGVAYHDTTAGNSGGVYRSDGVDIIASGSGYAVTGIAETEWTQYWVWSPAAEERAFPVTLRLACRADGRTIGITAAGVAGSTVAAVPNTGSTSVYANVTTTLRLKPGANDVRFAYHGDLMNFDYFTLDPAGVPAPDLTVPGAGSPPTGTIWNRTFRLSNQVANVGTAPAGPFTIGFYISTDDTITTADTPIGTRSIAGLDAGSVTPDEHTMVTVPPSVPSGRYFVGVIADPANVVTEVSELNNYIPREKLRTVDIADTPDLASWTYVPPQSPITRSFTIANVVKNLGTQQASPFYVGFYLSPDTAITTADTKIGEWYCTGLGAGAQSSLQQTPVTIPASVPAGTYYIGSILDSTGAVNEGNELNNLVSNFAPLVLPPGVAAVPGGTGVPTDTNADGKYDDVNGNGHRDFADVVLYFNRMSWITANEPIFAFDCNGNSRIDFADVIWLFDHL